MERDAQNSFARVTLPSRKKPIVWLDAEAGDRAPNGDQAT